MSAKKKVRIHQAYGETLSRLQTRPDSRKVRAGEFCDVCGARAKGKRHEKIGTKFLCPKHTQEVEEQVFQENLLGFRVEDEGLEEILNHLAQEFREKGVSS